MNDATSQLDGARPRRPLKARAMHGWKPVARFLVSRGLRPNTVSLVGLAAGIGTGVLLAATGATAIDHHLLLPFVLLLILLRGFCNILDGVMAVETGAATPVGALYNEVPDRISDVSMFLGAGYAMGSHPILGWAAALAAVFTAYVRVESHAAGAPADYRGLFGKPGRMVVLFVIALLVLVFPDGHPISVPLFGIPDLGLLGLGTLLIAAGSLLTSANRLRRAARFLSRPL